MYRRLPHGWRTTPAGIPTDLYMWQQFLSDPACRATGGTYPTVINLPSSLRRRQSPENRLTEMEEWSRKLQDPVWRDAFKLEVFDKVVRSKTSESMRLHQEIEAHLRARARLRSTIRTQQAKLGRLRASLDARERQISALRSDLAVERRRAEHLGQQVQAIQRSRGWRLLTRFARLKPRMPWSDK